MPRKYTKREWVPTQEAVKRLFMSRQTLSNRIQAKIFKRGIHYRNISAGKRPTYQFCIDEINKLYE